MVLFGIIFSTSLYENYKVVTLKLSKENFNLFFEHFPKDSIDIWSNDQSVEIDQDIEIMLSPEQYQILLNMKSTFSFTVSIENVQELIQRENQAMKNTERIQQNHLNSLKTEEEKQNYLYSEEYYQNYHNYDTIIKYVQGLKQRFPNMMDTFELGNTVENRTIHGFRIHGNFIGKF